VITGMIIGAFLYLLWKLSLIAFILARLRSSYHFDCYLQCFRPVGDFTFSLPAEKVSKKTDTESLSNPNHKLLL